MFNVFSGINPRGATSEMSKSMRPIVISLVMSSIFDQMKTKPMRGLKPEVKIVISHNLIGSASIQKNQITKLPRTEPQLFLSLQQ